MSIGKTPIYIGVSPHFCRRFSRLKQNGKLEKRGKGICANYLRVINDRKSKGCKKYTWAEVKVLIDLQWSLFFLLILKNSKDIHKKMIYEEEI